VREVVDRTLQDHHGEDDEPDHRAAPSVLTILASVASRIEDRLAELGLDLPPPIELPAGSRPAIAFVRRDGDHVYLSGNGPFDGRRLTCVGKLGAEVTIEQGIEAARLTALNHLRS